MRVHLFSWVVVIGHEPSHTSEDILHVLYCFSQTVICMVLVPTALASGWLFLRTSGSFHQDCLLDRPKCFDFRRSSELSSSCSRPRHLRIEQIKVPRRVQQLSRRQFHRRQRQQWPDQVSEKEKCRIISCTTCCLAQCVCPLACRSLPSARSAPLSLPLVVLWPRPARTFLAPA